MAKVPFAISTSIARNKKANSETLINLYADTMPPNAKSAVVLIGTPGWTHKVTLPTFPILGTHQFNGNLYAVTTTKAYKISPSNVVTEIGDVAYKDKSYVSIANNGLQMVIVAGAGYSYDGTTFAKITDPAYYPSDTVTFQDGYFIFNRSNSNQFFISLLYSIKLDATMYASAEGSPDNIIGLVSDHRQLWIFGTESIEVWYNSGDALFPFDRIQGSFSHRGCAGYKTIATLNNTVYWVGDDGVVYMANGYTPQPISTSAIQYRLATRGSADIRAFTYTEEGHFFYVLTIDGTVTFAFDTTTQLWHTRESINTVWGLRNMIKSDSGLIGTDILNGNLYYVGLDHATENGQTILRQAITSPLHNGVDYFTLHKFELDMETGKAPPNVDDIVILSFSSDGGVSFGNEKVISLGAQGERKKRILWRRLGRHRNLAIKVQTRSGTAMNIIAAYAEVS